MSLETTIISIGAPGRNMLWGENTFVRTQHATTTLICDGDRRIIVDPSLPGEILSAKIFDRTGMRLGEITDVFCTTLRLTQEGASNCSPTRHGTAATPKSSGIRSSSSD